MISHISNIFQYFFTFVLPLSDGNPMFGHDFDFNISKDMAVCQNLVPLVNIKIAGIYGCSSY